MITSLLPCPGCGRHVRRSDPSCPFCKTSLESAALSAPLRAAPAARLGRAATFAFGAAAIGSQVVGCSSSPTPPAVDAGTDAPAIIEDGGPVPLYGGPPDAGSEVDAGTPADDAGGPAPAYGTPPTDAGLDAGGGVGPLYGGAP